MIAFLSLIPALLLLWFIGSAAHELVPLVPTWLPPVGALSWWVKEGRP